MTEQEIRDMLNVYEIPPEHFDRVLALCREVERTTRHEFFRVIQTANNAAESRELTARELDQLIFKANQTKPDSEVQEMLGRWEGYVCTCDDMVGFRCEVCHDSAIIRKLVNMPATPATSAPQSPPAATPQ